MSYTMSTRANAMLARSNSEYTSFAGIMCFLLPIMSVPRVHIVGQLMLADVCVLFLVPTLLFSGRFYVNQPFLKPLLVLLVIWFGSAVAADLYNQSPAGDFLRGWAKIFFFALFITTFFILGNNREERYTMMMLGMSATLLLRWAAGVDTFQQGFFFSNGAWKFGNGYAVTILVCLFAARYRNGGGLLIIIFSALHLLLNARSLFLITFLTGASTFVSVRIRDLRMRIVISIVVIAAGIAALSLGMVIYGQLASSGVLGEEQQWKYAQQTAGGENLILGGRSESLIAFRAIADSPIFGHGSWAESLEYRVDYFSILEQQGRDIRWDALYKSLLIPTHSALLSSWVEHGIAGTPFWFSILGLSVWAIYEALFGVRNAKPMEMFLFIWVFWNILFSPFGLTARLYMAIYIAIICNFLYQVICDNRRLKAGKT